MQRVRHANRGRLLLRTPGPVPYGICKCSFVETIDTQSYITLVYDTFPWLDSLPNLTLLLNIGFHRPSATGVACRQGTLTPPDTWSCPTLGLACVLMSRPISPELVLSPDFWISNTPRYFSFAYKLRRVKDTPNFISSGSKIVKRLRRRQYDPLIIERTKGLVLGPCTALYRLFLKHCTLTNKAVGTIWRAMSKPLIVSRYSFSHQTLARFQPGGT